MPLVHAFTRTTRAHVSTLFSLRPCSIFCLAACISSIAVIARPIDRKFAYEYPILLSETVSNYLDSEGKAASMVLPILTIDHHIFGHLDPGAQVPPGRLIGQARFLSDSQGIFWPSIYRVSAARFLAPGPKDKGSVIYWRSLDDVMNRLRELHVIDDVSMENWKLELESAQMPQTTEIRLYISTFVIDEKENRRMAIPSLHIGDQYFGQEPAMPASQAGKYIGRIHSGVFSTFWADTHRLFGARSSAPGPRPYEGSIDYWRSLDDVMERLQKFNLINEEAMRTWKKELKSALTARAGESISLVVYRDKSGSRMTGEVSLLVGDTGKIISPDHDKPITAGKLQLWTSFYTIGRVAKDIHIDDLRDYAASPDNEHRFSGHQEDVAKWEKEEEELAPKTGRTWGRFKEWKWIGRVIERALGDLAFSKATQDKFFKEQKTLLGKAFRELRQQRGSYGIGKKRKASSESLRESLGGSSSKKQGRRSSRTP
ncbi:hypothetical protein EV361DRAFT_440365 [Lentinula raphanica]|nr:hypothetical protein EV361DRAFT_440365 [Lentinula raphanica]